MILPNFSDSINLLERLFLAKPSTQPAATNTPMIIYGAGELGKLALEYCKYVGIKVECMVDKHISGGGVFPLSCLKNLPNHPILISTASSPFGEIKDSLVSMGCSNVVSFYDYAQNFKDKHPINNGWYAFPISEDDKRGMTNVLIRLEGDKSRAAYLQSLAWRITREDWIFPDSKVVRKDRYFIPEVVSALTRSEMFLDIGSYDGRVVDQLIGIAGDIDSAVLIEPDSGNISKCPPREKVSIIMAAVNDVPGIVPFAGGFDYASRISDYGTTLTKCITIDSLDFNPTFIKIHAEGGELAAIIGGKNKIVKTRPILAVTTYHNRDGLWKIPLYLMTLLDDYDFYFRMHSWMGTGTVIYAIPRKRGLK